VTAMRQCRFAILLTGLLLMLPVFLRADAPQSALHPAGPAAAEISHLARFVLILFLIVAAVMWILILLVLTRPRGSFDEHAPIHFERGYSWIWIGGFAVPIVILATVFVSGLRANSHFPIHDGPAHPADIRITGHQWWWDIEYLSGGVNQYFRTANEIHIPAGRPVDIELDSVDVIHSFWVPALHGKVDLVPGQVNHIRIEADQPGTYSGQCAEYCGAQHANMKLLVIADRPEEFERWEENQRQDSRQAVDEQQRAGQDLFLSRPCGLCHTIRGTLANGRVGPDLTHIGSRQKIAANMLPNDDANLAAWITHAQALKPASEMPDITQFDGRQLQAMVAYLRQLQ